MNVSIIIVGYNGEKYLVDCITSLVNLDYFKNEYEIIYVDNASTDNSCAIIREFINKYGNIRLLSNNNNLGFTGGNNVGIKIAKGKYVALINQDAIADKKWLKELVSILEYDNSIGAIGGKIFYHNSKNLYSGGGKVFYGGLCWNWSLKDEKGDCDYISGCAMLIPRKILDEIGLLDEYLFSYYEDTDLCVRIKKAGYRILYAPEAIIWHNTPTKSKRPSKYITYYIQRNRVLYCYKNYKYKNFFLLLDILFLFNIFALYELIRVPASIKFVKGIINARIDSIKYCMNFKRTLNG